MASGSFSVEGFLFSNLFNIFFIFLSFSLLISLKLLLGVLSLVLALCTHVSLFILIFARDAKRSFASV